MRYIRTQLKCLDTNLLIIYENIALMVEKQIFKTSFSFPYVVFEHGAGEQLQASRHLHKVCKESDTSDYTEREKNIHAAEAHGEYILDYLYD